MPAPLVVETLQTPDSTTEEATLTTSGFTAAGDTLVILYGSDYYFLDEMHDPTSSAGELTLHGIADAGPNISHAKVYSVQVEASGEHTVTFPPHINCDIFGIVIRVRARLTFSDSNPLVNPEASTLHVAPSVEAENGNSLLVCFWLSTGVGTIAGNAFELPEGMESAGQPKASPFTACACAYELIMAPGDTGDRTATLFTSKISTSLSAVFSAPEDTEEPPDPGEIPAGADGPTTLGADLGWTYGSIAPLTNANGSAGDAIVSVGASPSRTLVNNNFRAISDKVNEVITAFQNAGYLS